MPLIQCFINDILVDEPRGLKDLELSVIRDETFHGIGFEAGLSSLEFFGGGANILRSLKIAQGLKATAIFEVLEHCDNIVTDTPTTLYRGRLNFGTYQENCGRSCSVTITVEEDSCITILKSRFDQKVDLDDPLAFDRSTTLADYAALGVEVTLPAVEFLAEDRSDLANDIDFDVKADPLFINNVTPVGFLGWISPAFDTLIWSSFGEYNASIFPVLYDKGAHNQPPEVDMPPTVDFPNPQIACTFANVTASYRLSGSVSQSASGGNLTIMRAKMFKIQRDLDKTVPANWTEIHSADLVNLTGTGIEPFDVTNSVSFTLNEDDQFYFGISFSNSNTTQVTALNFLQNADENFLDISAAAICEESTTEAYLIHETLSRVAESITNNCATVRSSYYGRVNSEPYDFAQNGCGGLRFVTSGLKIRKAEGDYFFASMKSLLEGLNAIDNIGFGYVPTDEDGGVVEVEAAEYFYQDTELFEIPLIPLASSKLEEGMTFSKIMIGYRKWEIEQINGLDEPNSNREYRTSFETLNNTIERLSELVAGSYAIEITRQQSFAVSGAADTSYDNDIFIICVKTDGDPGVYEVETGADILAGASNIFSPDSKYNLRITPVRNLLRWFKSTANSYVDLSDPANKLFFSSGTGNIDAVTELISPDDCDLAEGLEVSEKMDVDEDSFAEPPVIKWKNETIDFDYPLSLYQYNLIKATPYKKILYQCGTDGEFGEGWIKEIRYSPLRGMARFTLIKKYSE